MDTTMVASFLVLLVAFPTVFATDYTVGGDDGGWNTGVDYAAWTSGKTFKVGDNLVFKYGNSLHQVDEVDESGYKSCSSSNTIKSYQDGNSKVALTKAGKMYFICPTPGHCSANGGMKLEITVAAASTTPSGSPPSGSPPTTPSGSPSTTPSTPSNSPSGNTTSSPPPPGSSGAVSVSSGIISLLIGSFFVLAFMG